MHVKTIMLLTIKIQVVKAVAEAVLMGSVSVAVAQKRRSVIVGLENFLKIVVRQKTSRLKRLSGWTLWGLFTISFPLNLGSPLASSGGNTSV